MTILLCVEFLVWILITLSFVKKHRELVGMLNDCRKITSELYALYKMQKRGSGNSKGGLRKR
jgi:hypothetical protein